MRVQKSKLILFLLCSTTTVFCQAEVDKSFPRACPDASIVEKSPINESNLVEISKSREDCCDANGFPYHVNGKWSVEYADYFKTNYRWSFGMDIDADNVHEALMVVKGKLPGLVFEYGPAEEMGHAYCDYRSPKGGFSIETGIL